MKSMVRFLGVLAVLFGATAAVPAVAADSKSKFPGEFSVNAGLFSAYRYRGLDQADEEPALQGGIDWSSPDLGGGTTAYLGLWGSNVDFSDGDQASVEVDYYGGVTGTYEGIGNGIGWDVGFLYYSYPGAAGSLNYDFWEVYGGLSYDIMDNLSVGATYNFSPEFFGESGNAHFLNATLSYGIPVKFADLTFDASVGRQWVELNSVYGVEDYTTWSAGLTWGLTENVALSATYVDTSVSPSGTGNQETVIGALTASF